MDDSLETRHSPHVLSRRIWSFYIKRIVAVKKFDFSRPAFQGHIRSLKPTQIDRVPIILLIGDLTMALSRFRDKRRFRSIIANFPNPCI